MIGDSRKSDYLSPEVAQVPASVSHDMMSQFCLDMHDQAPSRPDSLSLRFSGAADDFSDLKAHQINRHYPSLKRSDTQGLDKVISQLDNNGSSPVTPTSFLNPKEITADQEQFADQLSKTFDKIKSERECVEELHLQRHSANGSPGFVNASPSRLCEDNPDGTQSRQSLSSMLRLPASSSSSGGGGMAPITASSASSSLCSATNAAQVAAVLYNLRGGSSLQHHHQHHHHHGNASPGESTSPASPSLENASGGNSGGNNNRFSTQRYPSLSLPPLRTAEIGGGGGGYIPVGLTDMLINSDDATSTAVTSTQQVLPTLADLTAAVTGQVIVNPTTDGFLQLFHNSSDQTTNLIDPNTSRVATTLLGQGGQQPQQRHLTNLMSSYETAMSSGHQQHQQQQQQHRQSGDYNTAAVYPGGNGSQQQQQDDLILLQQHRKRAPSLLPAFSGSPNATANNSTPSSTKRGRRRHEPTIAAAQALVNATTNSAGQLSYAPTDVAAMVSLKMEEGGGGGGLSMSVHHQPIQPGPPPQQTQATVVDGSASGSVGGGYDSMERSDLALDTMDEELCSDPSMARIEKKRARNRLAARRCRERKVTRIATLESEVDLLKAYVDRLRGELESSQKEASQLRAYLEQLADTYPTLGEKLKTLPAQPSHFLPLASSTESSQTTTTL